MYVRGQISTSTYYNSYVTHKKLKDLSHMQKRLAEQGLKFLEAGQFDKASQILSLLINRFPTNAEAHHMLGIIELEKGNYTQAYIMVNTALDLDETNSVFYNSMGNIELHRKNIAAAEGAFLRAIKFNPDKIQYQYNIANFYLSQNKFTESIDHYYEILRSNPTHYLSIRGITVAYLLSGETDIALEHATAWVTQYKDYDEPHYYHGLCKFSLNNITGALAAYDLGLKIAPTNHEILSAIGACYRALGNLNIAETYTHNALSLEPRNSTALYQLGCIHFDKGELATAKNIFYNANLLDPSYADPLCGLAKIDLAYGADAAALEHLAQAIKADPSSQTAKILRSTSLLRQQNFTDGWPAYLAISTANNLLRNIPKWTGNTLPANDTILIWTAAQDSDLSSQILFSKSFIHLQQSAAGVIVLCDQNLSKLLLKQFPTWKFLSKIMLDDLESNKLKITHQISSSELCAHFFKHQNDLSVSKKQSIIRANSARTQHFKHKYKQLFGDKITIGISWKSSARNATHMIDIVKSTHLHAWSNILNKVNCQFISIQAGDVCDELLQINNKLQNKIFVDPEVPLAKSIDLCELSAQIASLDLVISVDNFVLHLTGLLGVRTYALLAVPGEWYWFKDLKNSPWYPDIMLLQQERANDWSKPMQQLNSIL